MGMFDYVNYRGPLPASRKPRSRLRKAMLEFPSQSKSVRLWEDPKWKDRAYDEGCVCITVTEDGKMLDPDGQPLLWSGDMRFYGSGDNHRRWEFVAGFKDGKIIGIVEVFA
jgi:transposase InsO family protein